MSASGGGMCGIFCFLDGSAPLGWKGRAVVQPGNGAIFAECCSFRHDERNMEVSSRGPRRAVEPVRRINPAGSAGDSVAQSALFAPSYSEIWLPILAQIKKINGFVGIVSRETSSRPPALCLSSNARLDFCRRPQNLFCACFSCTSDDQARLAPCPGSSGLNAVGSMSRLVRLESVPARGDRPIHRLQNRAPNADSFSLKSHRKSHAKLPPAPNNSSFLIPFPLTVLLATSR